MRATATVPAQAEDQRLFKAAEDSEAPLISSGKNPEMKERDLRMERGRTMRAISTTKKGEQHLRRVPVVGELRISTSDQCSRCGSRRKTLVMSLGWICTACFDQCKEEAEKLVVARNARYRIPEAYERAINSYSKLLLP